MPFGRAIEGVYGVPIFAVHVSKHRFFIVEKIVVRIRRTHSSYAFVVRIRRTHSSHAFVVRIRRTLSSFTQLPYSSYAICACLLLNRAHLE